ncbi:MAG: zf-TFIIB domain-containing protein [Candidatus Sericytochromatia bacterium]
MTTPSEQEEKWFKEQELKQKREREAESVKQHDLHEKEARKLAHFMKCPKCGGDLQERDYEGVKIDVCTDCAGVWLDQGELEAISAEKSAGLFGFLRGRK